eukprot:scaffold4847_cov265-Pinguiococcus_pyrenoidosus.AAC.6
MWKEGRVQLDGAMRPRTCTEKEAKFDGHLSASAGSLSQRPSSARRPHLAFPTMETLLRATSRFGVAMVAGGLAVNTCLFDGALSASP